MEKRAALCGPFFFLRSSFQRRRRLESVFWTGSPAAAPQGPQVEQRTFHVRRSRITSGLRSCTSSIRHSREGGRRYSTAELVIQFLLFILSSSFQRKLGIALGGQRKAGAKNCIPASAGMTSQAQCRR